MTKFYQLLFTSVLLGSQFFSVGQVFNHSPNGPKKKSEFYVDKDLKPLTNPVTTLSLGCDTLLFSPDVITKYGAQVYTIGAGNGYLTGTNIANDKQKGNYFDVRSSFNSNYVTGVRFALGKVNGADLTKQVFFRVYNLETSSITLAGSSEGIPLSDLKPVVGNLVDYKFPTAIPLTSKVFIISLDYSNLSWAAHDSLALVSSAINSVLVPDSAVEQTENGDWTFMSLNWNGLDNGIFVYLFPYVSNNADCALPVKLSSFSATRFGTANKLSWASTTESGNKGFEVQRSSDGINFTAIGFVASKAAGGNSSAKLNYSYIDNATLSGNNYYRVKQVDQNLKATFTKTLLLIKEQLRNGGILVFYPNPVKNSLNVVLDLAGTHPDVLSITDLAGRTLITKNVQGNNSNQNVSLNVAGLAKGTYFLKLSGEGDKKLVKFVKN